MAPTEISSMMVAEVMRRWPVTVQTFNRRRMACPGCVMAPLMTVADAAAAYGLDRADLAGDLVAAIDEGATRPRHSFERAGSRL